MKKQFNLDHFYWVNRGYTILFSEHDKNKFIRQQVGDYKGHTQINVYVLPFLIGKCYAVKVA